MQSIAVASLSNMSAVVTLGAGVSRVFRRVRKIAKSDYCLRYGYPSVCPSIRWTLYVFS